MFVSVEYASFLFGHNAVLSICRFKGYAVVITVTYRSANTGTSTGTRYTYLRHEIACAYSLLFLPQSTT